MNQTIIDTIIKTGLQEDLTWGDVTTEELIDDQAHSELVLLQKQKGVVAGLEVAHRVFQLVDPTIKWQSFVQDGDFLQERSRLAKVEGKSRSLLIAERVALNFMQRMSGIATLTRLFVLKANQSSKHVKVLDTRKTTPGLRYLEKYAVRMGGGFNHRYNLSDSVLIKDNHLAIMAANGKDPHVSIAEMKKRIPHTVKIELEVDTLEQLKSFLDLDIDTYLLDNMSCQQLSEAVSIINGQAFSEASGGISLDNIAKVAATGVDFISVGALTHSAPSLDISLDFA
ncbi:MAG: carboxylating nicotinate-nucleotide diphosphorylase [Proteobacteria bacterium]|nr:carboxylating nicotinate-nucleotide diphosphorylase [Pseudomonadota bacterium]